MHVLVTGVAGFIGSTLARRLLERGDTVTGIDNINDYYEVSLKQSRLARLAAYERFTFIQPDMALFLFTRGILAGETIKVFNNGDMIRDFTYVDDIVEGIVRVIDHPAEPDPAWNGDDPNPATSYAPYRVFNIGNNQPVQLLRYIEVIEQNLGLTAKLDMMPMQAGDVPATTADVSALERAVGYAPSTPIEVGVARFVAWY